MDILIAIVPALMWGTLPLVVSKIGGSTEQQIIGTTLGALAFALVTFLFISPELSMTAWIAGLFSGAFWALGQMNQFAAFKQMGVSKTMPISTGMQLVGTSLFGVLAFGEWSNTSALILGISALVLIVAGAAFTSYKEDKSKKDENIGKGLLLLVISTIGYVGYVVIARWFNINGWEAVLPQAIGMVVSAILLSLRKGNLFAKQTFTNGLAGIMWAVGNIALLLATARVGVATSFSLSQTGVVISTIGGVLFLKEAKTKKEMTFVIIGCTLVVAGGIMIGFTKQ
ncbi:MULTISPECIES: GRP family sugar transporter [unclassified Exiguobacterium]|uniref:GRP family sugar transporter n=1 Tax=unclassified Exiguobacterium TaxID=2644629 RepID=UPI0019517D93|nr:GRP family sugar transporter [Exiguobacterium sp. N4-1P]